MESTATISMRPGDRVKRLLHYAALLPPFSDSARVDSNWVMGCTARIWLDAHLDDRGRVRFVADSDLDIHLPRDPWLRFRLKQGKPPRQYCDQLGFFQGPKDAPLEAASACTGVYAKGAYPGYADNLVENLLYPFLYSLSDFRSLPDKPHKNIVRLLKGKPFRRPDISATVQGLLEGRRRDGGGVVVDVGACTKVLKLGFMF